MTNREIIESHNLKLQQLNARTDLLIEKANNLPDYKEATDTIVELQNTIDTATTKVDSLNGE